ncbi:SOS response-associated peptidase [Natronospora cellulosivora (SeqCode)]
MCGRYYVKISINKLLEKYGIINEDFYTMKERKNKEIINREIFPSQEAPIIIKNNTSSGPIIQNLKWGFSPSYSKRLIINARAETIDSKKTFKKAFLKRRCLVPASAFFEWEKSNNTKLKQRIFLKNKNLFSLAAIYDSFSNEKGKKIYAFTIITTSANNKISSIHNRMPVILNEKDEKKWLDTNFDDPIQLKGLLQPYPNEEIDIIPENKKQSEQMKLDFNDS